MTKKPMEKNSMEQIHTMIGGGYLMFLMGTYWEFTKGSEVEGGAEPQ